MTQARQSLALLLLLLFLMLTPAAAADSTRLTINVRNGTEVVPPTGMSADLSVSCRVDTQTTEKRLAFEGGSIVCPVPIGATVELMINYLLYSTNSESTGEPRAMSFRLNAGWQRQLKLTANTELSVTLPRAQRVSFSAVDSDGQTMPSASFNIDSGSGVYGRMPLDNTGAEYLLAVREWSAWKAEPNYELIGFDAAGAFAITAERDGTNYTWQSGKTSFTNGAKLTGCIDTGRGKYKGNNAVCTQSRAEEQDELKLRTAQVESEEFERRATDVLRQINAAVERYGSRASALLKFRKSLELLIAKKPGMAGVPQLRTIKNSVDQQIGELTRSAAEAAIKAGKPCAAKELGKTVVTGSGSKFRCTKSKAGKSPTWSRLS